MIVGDGAEKSPIFSATTFVAAQEAATEDAEIDEILVEAFPGY